jgi:hypothetical protein
VSSSDAPFVSLVGVKFYEKNPKNRAQEKTLTWLALRKRYEGRLQGKRKAYGFFSGIRIGVSFI